MNTPMKITMITASEYINKDEFPKFETLSEQYNFDGGLSAGICYMPNDFEALKQKPQEVTEKRAVGTISGGHHSVMEHNYISFIFEGIPKLFAMLLNNEKTYVTSEKSARYTVMQPSAKETEFYNKWCEIFKKEIAARYGNEKYFDEKRINKLAMENARYLISVYTPTTMRYTVSYRQLNYIYNWLKKENGTVRENKIFEPILPYVEDFCARMEELKVINPALANDQKDRDFSLINKRIREEHFGDVYSINYKGTLAQFAQAQRHRTLSYEMHIDPVETFYIPQILLDKIELVRAWVDDIFDLEKYVPQGKLVLINERGTYENLILKAKERLCTAAQLEINNQTKRTIQKFIENCKDKELVAEMAKYNKGARCTFPNYKCPTPCGFADGVNLERLI